MASWRLTKLHPGSGVGRPRSRFWFVASAFALVGALFVGIGSSPAGAVPITVNGLRVYTYNCLRKAGIEGHSPHSLRRTFATEAVRRGVQPHVLAAILRHSSIATSSHYVRVSLDDMAEALQAAT